MCAEAATVSSLSFPLPRPPKRYRFLHLPSPDRSQRDEPGPRAAYVDAYGLEVEADIHLPGARSTRTGGHGHCLKLVRAAAHDLPGLLDRPRFLRNLQAYDGAPFAMLEDHNGEVLFAYGRSALVHLPADRATLRYVVADAEDPAWQRVLMDTILWTASLLRGFELLHAGAVSDDRGLIALVAHTGGGKSSLAAEFLRRGAVLFADDIVALSDAGGTVVAHPGPPLMNLPRAVAPDGVGARTVADFGEERWVALDRGDVAPGPMTAVVLINRVAGETLRCTPTPATSLTLLPHAVTLPHLQDRARRRFDIFGALVAHAPVFSLHADPAVPPSDLADVIEDRLAST